MNKKDYLIVFGDPDKFVEYAKVPPSHSLKIIPFAEKLKKMNNSKSDTLVEILTEAQKPTMFFLFAFFKDFEEMKKVCDEDPSMFMMADLDDLDDEEKEGIGHRVFGIGRELFTIEMDVHQAAAGHQIDNLRFPDGWEVCKAPLLLGTGEIKRTSGGFSGMLEKRALDIRAFSWAKAKGIEPDDIKDLPHVNMMTVQLLNTAAVDKDQNAPFTVYTKKDAKVKRPVLRAVTSD